MAHSESEHAKGEYEIAFLLRAPEEEAAIADALLKAGAAVTFSSPVSQIKLAYPIQKQNAAHFGFRRFLLTASGQKALSGDLALRPGVLRFLIVSTSPAAARPSPRWPRMEEKPASPGTLSNEALEEKLEEILK